MKLKIVCLGLLISWFLTPLMSNAQERFSKFRYTAQLMGTNFSLTFYATSGELAERAAAASFERVEELNQIFSDYLQDSEITTLSNTAGSGKRIRVSEDLWRLLKYTKRFSRQSNGAFDVTIGPLTKLWRKGIRQEEHPDNDKIAQAKERVNYKWVKLYPFQRKVKLKKPGMRLDFGGIAKGYAVDQAYKILEERFGIRSAIVDGGGDLFIAAPPPNDSAWEVKNADNTNIEVRHYRAIASSGDTYKYLQWQGKRYSHILDPASGNGKVDTSVITVTAPNTMLADAMATTFTIASDRIKKKLTKKYDITIIN